MIKNNEKTILNLIKIGPLFVIVFAILITYVMLYKNNKLFEQEILKEKTELIEQKKNLLKLEITRVYDYIENEKKESHGNIKKELKERVNTAYTIAQSIYSKNKDEAPETIKKLIKDALRELRFDGGHSYFFIDDINGYNILHPIMPEFEGKNILSFKDNKGNPFVKQMIDAIKQNNETYINWWWARPDNKNKEFEKLGFAKLFEPFNWIIATGEYIVDHEKKLQNEILKKINKIKYGVDGYIFAYDYQGKTLSHVKKSLLGTNRFNLKDKNGNLLVQDIINLGKNGEGFMSYIGTIKPSTGEPAEKISYIKGIPQWNWVIGTGTYISELDEIIKRKKDALNKNNTEFVLDIIVISTIASIITFLLSIIFAKVIENKFTEYKNEVEELNNNLELKVKKRTEKLKETNIKLKSTLENLSKTKSDLIESEKMAMLGELVGNITHEINTPLGLSITSISHIQSITKKITDNYNKEQMTQEEFESFLKDIEELTKIVSINLKNSSMLVNSFKNVAVDQAIEEKREFNLKNYIEEILLSLKNKTKKTKLKIDVDCENDIFLHTFPNYIFQILTNLINNSILHGFEENEEGLIKISVINFEDSIELIYKDNGKGIKEELQEDIFKQYFTTKRGHGGTGLGLHIIQKIVVEKLRGKIEFNSSINNGVEFRIKIPKNIN